MSHVYKKKVSFDKLNKLMEKVRHLESRIVCLKTALEQEVGKAKKVELLNDLSFLLLKDKKAEEALKYAEKAIKIFDGQSLNKDSAVKTYLNAGDSCAQQQQYITALTHYQNALDYCEENSEEQAEILLHIVAVYVDSEQKDWSKATFGKAVAHLNWLVNFYEKKRDQHTVAQLHKQLYQLHKQLGNFEKALIHNELYQQQSEELKTKKKEQIHELRQEVLRYQQLADFLNGENERLYQKINTEIKKFTDIIAHDFRSPLNHIKAFAGLLRLRNEAPAFWDTENATYIEVIEKSAEKLQSLLQDLVKYSTLGFKENPPSDLSLEHVLTVAKAKLEKEITETQAQIISVPLPIITVHFSHFLQLFYHLLDNSIKFRKKTKAPIIHISLEESENYYTLHFKDNGIGIAPEHYQRIFDIFKRLHTSEEYGGTGIGLSMCKKIVESYDGKITVSAILDTGSIFHIRIPKKINS